MKRYTFFIFSLILFFMPISKVSATSNIASFNPDKLQNSLIKAYKSNQPSFKGAIQFITWDNYEKMKNGEHYTLLASPNPIKYIQSLQSKLSNTAMPDNLVKKDARVAPYNSIPESVAYWESQDGFIIEGSNRSEAGTSFKVSDEKLVTAAHTVYDTEYDLGKALQLIVFFGMTSENTDTFFCYGETTKINVPDEYIKTVQPDNPDTSAHVDYATVDFPKNTDEALIPIDQDLNPGYLPPNLPLEIAPDVDVSNITSIGHPYNASWGIYGWDPYETAGSAKVYKLNGINGAIYYSDNMHIEKGMSGGPVLDSKKNIIGINVMKDNTTYDLNARRIDNTVYSWIVSH